MTIHNTNLTCTHIYICRRGYPQLLCEPHVIRVIWQLSHSLTNKFCWLELRLRWAHQAQKQQIADCFDKQPVPRFSCNDTHPRSQSAIDTGMVWGHDDG